MDVVKDVSEIASSYCPSGSKTCRFNMHQATLEESKINRYGRHNRNLHYADTFDSKVRETIDDIQATVDGLTLDNVNESVDLLLQYQAELQSMEDVDSVSQMVGLVSVSVAIESSKLWHETITTQDHPLHDMLGYFDDGSRKLQARHDDDYFINDDKDGDHGDDDDDGDDDDYYTSFFDIAAIVRADVDAATEAGITTLTLQQNPALIIQAIGPAIIGSARAAFSFS